MGNFSITKVNVKLSSCGCAKCQEFGGNSENVNSIVTTTNSYKSPAAVAKIILSAGPGAYEIFRI